MNIKNFKSVKSIIAIAILTLSLFAATTAKAQSPTVKNVVLVHGAFADGSGWRGVYDILTKKGYNVAIVQIPLTSLKDDVAATQRVLDRLDGPTVLVGHSWGGAVITEAGNDPKVVSLVYVAAFVPDAGESAGQWATSVPPAPENGIIAPEKDGFFFYNKAKFHAGFAADLSKEESDFMEASQVPIAASSFGAQITKAAWKTRPSFAVLTTQDKSILPEIQTKMYKRANSTVTELKSSHVGFISHPAAVADVIIAASKVSVKK